MEKRAEIQEKKAVEGEVHPVTLLLHLTPLGQRGYEAKNSHLLKPIIVENKVLILPERAVELLRLAAGCQELAELIRPEVIKIKVG